MSDKIQEYISKLNETYDDNEYNASTLIDLLSYSTVNYRVLLKQTNDKIDEINKKHNKKLINIEYTLGANLSIIFCYMEGKIKVRYNYIGNIDYESDDDLLDESPRLIKRELPFIKYALSVLKSTTEMFKAEETPNFDLFNLYQNLEYGDISLVISPIYEPMIFYKGIDVTKDGDVILESENIYRCIPIDTEKLIPQFRKLYEEVTHPFSK